MQVASVSTDRPTLRDEIWGWGFEDSALFVRKSLPNHPYKVFIGYTPSPKIPTYGTVLEMLSDGWKLLGVPLKEEFVNDEGKKIETYTWWLTREPSSLHKGTL